MHEQESEIKSRLCARLTQLREAKGWSYKEMALACDMDKSQYIKLELGHVTPGIVTLCSIADGHGISLAELVKGVYPIP